MNKLMNELIRLYGPPTEADGAPVPALRDAAGQVRALLVEVKRPVDWPAVATLYEAVQTELDWPAPAVSVSGQAGFRLWFSLAEAVPPAQAAAMLRGLRQTWLSGLPDRHVWCLPGGDEPVAIEAVPALHAETGKWSAFIDPSMGSMFVDESGLDMAPNLERQADMLAALRSIKPADFQRGLAHCAAAPSAAAAEAPPMSGSPAFTDIGGGYTDPRQFLLAVMNDPAVPARERIRAAKILLQHPVPGDER